MPPKTKKIFVCTQCGYESAKWVGKCPDCGQWNSMSEEIKLSEAPSKGTTAGIGAAPIAIHRLNQLESGDEIRIVTGIEEIDRVLGGGIVPGSVVLVSGDPGIGKSTILLQLCNPLGEFMKILYISGEESVRQIKLRAIRVGVNSDNLYICCATDIDTIVETIEAENPQLVIIDSIQTMNLTSLPSSPGSVTQIKECSARLIQLAKQREMPLFLVGHVNKDGAIAGPKVLEHMVDTVLYFEGERHLPYRILRAVKNRYGSTNEIGVFEMMDSGLGQVENPSLALLSGRPSGVSGSCVACVMEGSRPILSEVQALVSKSSFSVPKRTATGYDFNRVSMLLAVLEKRGGFPFSSLDAYINVVGGLRLADPAADLAVALSLISNMLDKPIDESLAVFGELGLAGEVRSVSHIQKRVSECYRLGFKRILLPKQSLKQISCDGLPGLELIGIRSISEARTIIG